MEVDPTRVCELLVGLPDVNVLGVIDAVGLPVRVVIESRGPRPACSGCAGAVVVKDVPDFALVAGTPARFLRWVGRAGVPLEPAGDDRFRCPRTGSMYVETDGRLREIEQEEPA